MKKLLKILFISTLLTVFGMCGIVLIDFFFEVGFEAETFLMFAVVIFAIVLVNVDKSHKL